MSNSFFKPVTYPFMYEDTQIGTMTIDCDKDGEYTFQIEITDETHIPWALKNRNGSFISSRLGELHYRLTRSWVEERIFPRERHNADDILKKLGLAEYDELAILKKTRASNRYDKFWIKVEETDKYEETISARWRNN